MARTRALFAIAVLFAATIAARGDTPERLTDRKPPSVTLAASDGWRLTAVLGMEVENGTLVLVIEGDVINATDQDRASPTLRFALRDTARREISSWTLELAEPRIKAGDWLAFATRVEHPPESAVNVEIKALDQE